MDLANTKVLVTGAGGFIGSHLAEKLTELGASVKALVHYNSAGSQGWLDCSEYLNDIEVIAGDIRDQDNLGRAVKGVDIIFHLAALIAIPYSYYAPMAYVRTNVEGTLNVLQTAMNMGVSKVIHTSTSEVYGSALYVPIDEKHPLQGQSPYSASKIGADKIAEAVNCSFELPIVTIRPFNTFGPRQSARAVIPTIIGQALEQDKICLGNLDPTRDLTFVTDTVMGFIKGALSDNAVGKTINLGTGKEISIGKLAETILEVIGRDIPIVTEKKRLRPENSEVDRLCSNNAMAGEILGWTPEHSLKEGIAETVKWIKNNLHHYRTNEYTT